MKLHLVFWTAFIAMTASACVVTHAAPNELTIVLNGISRFSVVHAEDAPNSVRIAAKELQHYVEKSTGAKLPIVVGRASALQPFIALGDTQMTGAESIYGRDLPVEGFQLVTRGGNFFIVGPDTREDEKTPEGGTSSGTLNGVYTFLEDYLGIRWLLPGSLGEDVPKRESIVLSEIDRIEKPFFLNRRMPGIQNEQPAVKEWSARHKLGFSLMLEHSHNWQRVVPSAMQEMHPDWFPELAGKRPLVAGDRYKLETTNPELIQHYAQTAIRAFRQNPKLSVFSLSPTDSAGWSTSPESMKHYERNPHGKLSVTPLILKFYNDVAKIVGKEFPDRKLAGYIYADYLYPPSNGVPQLETNLFIVVAPSMSYGYQLYRNGVKEDWEYIMKTWSAKTSQIAYYDLFNWLRGNTGAITPPAPEILNFAFPRLMNYGIKGIYIYGTAEWSQAAVNNYVLAKMAWNPALDANTVCDEFYQRAYGPAAGEPMRKIYRLVDDAVKVFYNQDLTANYTATPRFQSVVLAANFAQIESHYWEAQRVAKEASPAQQARLEFFGDNLRIMYWQLHESGLLSDAKNSNLFRDEVEVERMFGRFHAGFGVELAPGMKRTEKPFLPVSVARASALSHPRTSTSLALRGLTRFLCFPKADQEISVTATKILKSGSILHYDAYAASGAKVAGGILRVGTPSQFLGSAGQIFYVEINCADSPYEVELKGSPYALASDSIPRGLHLSGKSTRLYFQVPADVPQFSVTVSTGPPGETSLGKIYTPSGTLVQTLDTQSTPVARAIISPEQGLGEWEGFWCLSVEKAPKGVLDDVFVSLDAALPQWFIIDPSEPLKVSPLKAFTPLKTFK